MPMSNRIEKYEDVRTILDSVLETGGGKAFFPTKGKAETWRFRAYHFMKLWREGKGGKPKDKYNMLTLKRPEEPEAAGDEWSIPIIIDVKEQPRFEPFIEPDSETEGLADQQSDEAPDPGFEDAIREARAAIGIRLPEDNE